MTGNPLLKCLLEEPKFYINILSSGVAWQIDLRNCVAKKVNLGDPENNEHPYNFTLCDTIEAFAVNI